MKALLQSQPLCVRAPRTKYFLECDSKSGFMLDPGMMPGGLRMKGVTHLWSLWGVAEAKSSSVWRCRMPTNFCNNTEGSV